MRIMSFVVSLWLFWCLIFFGSNLIQLILNSTEEMVIFIGCLMIIGIGSIIGGILLAIFNLK